ncbi:MAG: hypothetical protein ACRCUY_06125, partial [Thermoguttaceae bacterium]
LGHFVVAVDYDKKKNYALIDPVRETFGWNPEGSVLAAITKNPVPECRSGPIKPANLRWRLAGIHRRLTPAARLTTADLRRRLAGRGQPLSTKAG